jgi:hypothetical protein
MITFKEAREQILSIGIEELIFDEDGGTEMRVLLKNGKSITIYTTEITVIDAAEYNCEFVQSELRFMAGDIA